MFWEDIYSRVQGRRRFQIWRSWTKCMGFSIFSSWSLRNARKPPETITNRFVMIFYTLECPGSPSNSLWAPRTMIFSIFVGFPIVFTKGFTIRLLKDFHLFLATPSSSKNAPKKIWDRKSKIPSTDLFIIIVSCSTQILVVNKEVLIPKVTQTKVCNFFFENPWKTYDLQRDLTNPLKELMDF